jgi:DNA-binding IclR family transcriptional regulator
MFVIHVIRYKWDDRAPYPSLANIAKQMGISTTSARALARSLENKNYLRREGTPGRTNKYHLDRLFAALESITHAPPAVQQRQKTAPDETDSDIPF